MATTIACPACGKALKTVNPVREGNMIKCPSCKHVFRVPPEQAGAGIQAAPPRAAPTAPPPPPPAAPVPTPRDDSDARKMPRPDDDDRPRKRRDDDDDDDRPRKRRDDDDDDRPRSKRPPRDDDDDDRPRRRRARDDDDDDRPRRRRPKGGIPVKMLLAGGGGLLLLVVIMILFVWPGVLMSSNSGRIVGTWELSKGDKKNDTDVKIEFKSDGNCEYSCKVGGIPWPTTGTYTVSGDELTVTFRHDPPGKNKIKTLTATDLIVKNEDGQIEEWKRK